METKTPRLGLALSGGGIRSATFNLGVLQALADGKLLGRVDMLSTVSGGGYIGSWLLGLVRQKMEQGASPANAIFSVEGDLSPKKSGDPASRESKPIHFLRQYSNYLTPEKGFFSLDTWTIASIWLRNTLLNQMILVPMVAILVLLPRAMVRAGAFGFDFLPAWLKWGSAVAPWHLTAFALPITVALGSLGLTLLIGLVGRGWKDETREWWSRVGACFNIVTLSWSLVAVIAIYGPWAVAWAGVWVHTLTIGWIISTAIGVLAGRNPSSGTTASASESRSGIAYWASAIAPYVFALGLLIVVSSVIHFSFIQYGCRDQAFGHEHEAACRPTAMFSATGLEALKNDHWELMQIQHAAAAWVAIGALLIVVLIFAWRVDINEFSMHNLYKNRLVRCYLGAARSSQRKPTWIGMDPKDDFPLSALDGCRPYPIINATLNLVNGDDLAWQERKGESFVFSPDYCGFERPPLPTARATKGEMRPTAEYAGGVTLGTAFSTSGAALNPSWGYHSSPATSLLMAIFNVRMGQWFGNPAGEKWKNRGPKSFIYWLMELLALTNDKSDYVNLTDGGHFENLGIYELVRRKCTYIIACDAGEDGAYAFEDLGNALRKCRTDFGVKIDIQTSMVRPDPKTGWSDAHCAVGRIEYDEDHTGHLLYLKASLTGDEPEDVLQYHKSQSDFPHQSTADQWFDESQFESYRALGFHVADSVIGASLKTVSAGTDGAAVDIGRLFRDLDEAWYPPSEFIKDSFTRHTATFDQLMERLRRDSDLAFLLPELYPSARTAYPQPLKHQTVNAFLFCNALIQLMENVYIDLHLDEAQQLDHPHNKGWLELFIDWASSETFRNAWKVAAPTFGKRFRDFCVRKVGLPEV